MNSTDVCESVFPINLIQMTPFPRRAPIAVVLVAVLFAVLASAVGTPRAAAASDVKYGLTDDAWLQDGPGTLNSRLAQLDALGVQIVRFTLNWNQIAPTRPGDAKDPNDPAYNWSDADTVLNGLRADGIAVLLQLNGTPSWANGGHASNYAPTSASTFGAFASAAAQHYSWVKRWLIWNEPNQVRWLRPTTAAVYTTRLLNPAYTAIHAVIRGAQVGGGATAPRGSTGGVSPVAWIAGMHAAHAKLDAYAHDPYPLDPKSESPLTGGCGYCETITMATINRLVTLVARDFGNARIWLSEYGYQSNPPDPLLGVSLPLQARYIGEAAYRAYRTPRVDLLIHFLYRDEPELSRFQSGLITIANKRKPAYAAFQLPLVETGRSGTHTTLWGQLLAPAAGRTATLQVEVGNAWRTLATLHGSIAGYVRWSGTLARGREIRLRAGTIVGPPLAIT